MGGGRRTHAPSFITVPPVHARRRLRRLPLVLIPNHTYHSVGACRGRQQTDPSLRPRYRVTSQASPRRLSWGLPRRIHISSSPSRLRRRTTHHHVFAQEGPPQGMNPRPPPSNDAPETLLIVALSAGHHPRRQRGRQDQLDEPICMAALCPPSRPFPIVFAPAQR